MADDLTRNEDDGDTDMESDTEYTYSSYHPGMGITAVKKLSHGYPSGDFHWKILQLHLK